ncbi:MAG: flagellar hook-length control protein FliK [Pseudomonadota bacterium]
MLDLNPILPLPGAPGTAADTPAAPHPSFADVLNGKPDDTVGNGLPGELPEFAKASGTGETEAVLAGTMAPIDVPPNQRPDRPALMVERVPPIASLRSPAAPVKRTDTGAPGGAAMPVNLVTDTTLSPGRPMTSQRPQAPTATAPGHHQRPDTSLPSVDDGALDAIALKAASADNSAIGRPEPFDSASVTSIEPAKPAAPVPVPLPKLTELTREGWPDRAAAAIAIAGIAAGKEARFQLNPPELGQLSVELGGNADDLKVEIISASEPARQELERHLPRLIDRLREDLMNAEAERDRPADHNAAPGASSDQTAERDTMGQPGGEARSIEDTDSAPPEPTAMKGTGRVSLFA